MLSARTLVIVVLTLNAELKIINLFALVYVALTAILILNVWKVIYVVFLNTVLNLTNKTKFFIEFNVIFCFPAGCRSDSDCSRQHACLNRECVPVCSPDGSSCGTAALCYGSSHRAVCSCPPGLTGDPQVGCRQIECEKNSDCPSDKACVNTKCVSPCTTNNRCIEPAECTVYNHIADCSCPPGYVGTLEGGCTSGKNYQ